jgi:dolichyl-phosphate beta-glucosyltransferase
MEIARGRFVLFADADGATTFAEIDKLITAVGDQELQIAVGSRAHLVGDAVVKRTFLRNLVMRIFHLLVMMDVQDTQCGFKLFTRKAAQMVVPRMTSNGWMFDVEMLLHAKKLGIKVHEIGVEWTEIPGTKLQLMRESIKMFVQLMLIRLKFLLSYLSNLNHRTAACVYR